MKRGGLWLPSNMQISDLGRQSESRAKALATDLSAQSVFLTECFPVFHLRTVRKGCNFSNFLFSDVLKFVSKSGASLPLSYRSNVYDEASSLQSKRLKLNVLSLKNFVYICPENLLHFNLIIFDFFFLELYTSNFLHGFSNLAIKAMKHS